MGGGSPHVRNPQNDAGEPAHPDAALPREHVDLLRLKRVLETDYEGLIDRLSASLQSHDRAADALHDAYIRLSGSPKIGEVRNPVAYLYRMVMNLAHNIRVREMRSVAMPSDMLDTLSDESPGPERTAIANIDRDKMLEALASLPARRREIFLARWRDDLSQTEIAVHFSLHKRTVQKELARAERFLHGRTRLGE